MAHHSLQTPVAFVFEVAGFAVTLIAGVVYRYVLKPVLACGSNKGGTINMWRSVAIAWQRVTTILI